MLQGSLAQDRPALPRISPIEPEFRMCSSVRADPEMVGVGMNRPPPALPRPSDAAGWFQWFRSPGHWGIYPGPQPEEVLCAKHR